MRRDDVFNVGYFVLNAMQMRFWKLSGIVEHDLCDTAQVRANMIGVDLLHDTFLRLKLP